MIQRRNNRSKTPLDASPVASLYFCEIPLSVRILTSSSDFPWKAGADLIVGEFVVFFPRTRPSSQRIFRNDIYSSHQALPWCCTMANGDNDVDLKNSTE